MGKFNDAIASDLPTLVDFYATWCRPCQTMHPILDEIKSKEKDKIRILKIDVDKNAAIAEKFKIKGVPTFILFKSGEVVWRKSGVIPLKELSILIKKAY
jgi:thioredoxin 1